MNKSDKTYTLEDIRNIIVAHNQVLKDKYKAIKFYLFGSYARGEQSPDSDIDLLVEFSESIDMFEFVNLKDYLKEIFEKEVDLGTPRSLKPFVKEKILKEAVAV